MKRALPIALVAGGVTLAINVESRYAVDAAILDVLAAGGSLVSAASMPPNRVAVTVARPNLPYSSASSQAGIQRLRIKVL